jgi:hypothetical protein
MITLTRNGHTKTIGRRSFELLKGNLDGWMVETGSEKPEKPTGTQAPEVKEPSREEMLAFLKLKGVKISHLIGDEKLKQRYELEL